MNSNSVISTRAVFLLVAALLAFASLSGALEASAKQKKGPPTGRWSGDATYTSPPEAGGGGGVKYESSIVVTVERLKGAARVTGMYVTVRTYCIDAVHDIRIYEDGLKNGPKVGANGDFTFKAHGATIKGHLGRPRGFGTIRATSGGCVLSNGKWEAKKRKY